MVLYFWLVVVVCYLLHSVFRILENVTDFFFLTVDELGFCEAKEVLSICCKKINIFRRAEN